MVENLQDVDKQGNIEPCLFDREDADGPDNIEKILSFNILSKEVDVVVILEGTIVLHKEGRILQTDKTQGLFFFLNRLKNTLMKSKCLCFTKGLLEMHFKAKFKFYFS